MLTPITDREKSLIVKNVVAACKDIHKLNKRGYGFLYVASGFIAHYNLGGFIDYYTRHSLADDIANNSATNQWGGISVPASATMNT